MKNDIYLLVAVKRLTYVLIEERKIGLVKKRGNVRLQSTGKIVKTYYMCTLIKQYFTEPRAQKTGSSRY